MSIDQFIFSERPTYGRALARRYALWFAWYLFGVIILWQLGIEAIYKHPTPYYAYFHPTIATLTDLALVLAAGWFAYLVPVLLLYPRRRFSNWGTVWRLGVLVLLCAWAVYRFVLGAGFDASRIAAQAEQTWSSVRWLLLPGGVFILFLALWWWSVSRLGWFQVQYSPKQTTYFVLGCMAFSGLFSVSIALLDGTADGIFGAYNRHGLEYVSDIGLGGSIQGLFRDYLELHPYLSIHAKVHPPGPIALLWLMSYGVGRSPEALSIATIIFASLSIIPLYGWVSDMTSPRTARTFCLVYTLVPTIVLFTATSADIAFMPFTATTLFCFWRAMHRRGVSAFVYALAAGILYGLCSLISFNLLIVGAFFGFVGLWRLTQPGMRFAVFRTAALMFAAFLSVHGTVWWWSGFDVIACLSVSMDQFNIDQALLDEQQPRWPGWVWRIVNPIAWVYFLGIPTSVLLFWRLRQLDEHNKGLFRCTALTLLVLTLLYLARGEGERSAMYIVPFAVLHAAHILDELGARTRSYRPILATAVFLAIQCWLTEAFLYTYW